MQRIEPTTPTDPIDPNEPMRPPEEEAGNGNPPSKPPVG